MPREPLWEYTDHDKDQARFHPVIGCGGANECVAGLHIWSRYGAAHLTREALGDLVRAAAPLAGLTVVDGEPSPEVDGEPGLDPEDRAAAVAAVWGGRCKGESTGWLWGSTVDVAHYIATGEVPA